MMSITHSSMAVKSFERPDDTRRFADKGSVEIVSVAGVTAMRLTYGPGWRWSHDVKPIAGTASGRATSLWRHLATMRGPSATRRALSSTSVPAWSRNIANDLQRCSATW